MDNCFFSPSQPRRSYQGDSNVIKKLKVKISHSDDDDDDDDDKFFCRAPPFSPTMQSLIAGALQHRNSSSQSNK